MRAVWLTVAAVVLGLSARASGRDGPPEMLPQAAPAEQPALAGGTPVSRPLTPVEIPPELPPAQPPEPVQRLEEICEPCYEQRGPLGPAWDSMELLLWWPRAHPLPPLVSATRSGAPPVLDAPGTTLLIGNRAIANQDMAGGRFTLGRAVNDSQTLGLELIYLFLGSRTLDETLRHTDDPRIGALGIPFINAATGREDVFPLAAPGTSTGSIFVTTTTRVQGAEANIVANLHDGGSVRFNGLVGYRFLQVHEGLTLEQMRVRFGAPGEFGPIYDEFNAHNRFHGGQLGLHADIDGKWFFCELVGKVALGQTFEVVRIDGATTVYTPVLGGLSVRHAPGGILALPSNIGRFTGSTFAVVPEGTFKIGVKFGDTGRFFVGYNFLYLSDAIRPGDQVDRTLSPAQIPALNPTTALVADRPRAHFNRSDFWAQGLIIGLESRY